MVAALTSAGCAYRLDSMFSEEQRRRRADRLRSTRPGTNWAPPTRPPHWPRADLAYARAAAADALARGGRDFSIPWENPHTGAGGNITPLAAAYTEGSLTCRDFLASYVRGQSQAWLQGEACRADQGRWEVKSLKPLKQG